MGVGEPQRPVGGRGFDEAAESRAAWGTRWRFSWAWGATAVATCAGILASAVLLDGRTQEIVFGLCFMLQGVHVLYWNEPWTRVARFMGARRSAVIAGGVGAILGGAVLALGLLAP